MPEEALESGLAIEVMSYDMTLVIATGSPAKLMKLVCLFARK